MEAALWLAENERLKFDEQSEAPGTIQEVSGIVKDIYPAQTQLISSNHATTCPK
jgi:hypothetical protein